MYNKVSAISKMALIALLVGAGLQKAHAGAVITNPEGTVALGVNDEGHLNIAGAVPGSSTFDGNGAIGLSYITHPAGGPANFYNDGTAPGCLCEGWGVSASGISGYANVSTDGVVNLTSTGFSSTASTATASVKVTSLPALTVTQAYAPATEAGAAGVLFKDTVTITNTGLATLTDVKYVRVMDWDIPPTEFNEVVTIKGVPGALYNAITNPGGNLELSHDDGFESANPLDAVSDALNPGTTNTDFTDLLGSTSDHGAFFRFRFGDLAAGESKTFSIYYGATTTEASALTALGAVGIELFSLGQSSSGTGPTVGDPFTFIFGFKGVGGIVVVPPTGAVPEPSTYGLIGAALLGAVVYLRRRRA